MRADKIDKIALGIFWAAIGFCTAMLFSEPTIANVEWETLLTGVLAVGAAVYTVRAMKAADDAQETRHRDLRNIELRADGLAVWRAAVPFSARLGRWVDEVEQLWHRCAPPVELTDDWIPKQDAISEFVNIADRLADLHPTQDVMRAEPLFPPRLAGAFSRYDQRAERILSLVRAIKASLQEFQKAKTQTGNGEDEMLDRRGRYFSSRRQLHDALRELGHVFTNFVVDGRQVSRRLEALLKKYEASVAFIEE